jgi:hypothetical protein
LLVGLVGRSIHQVVSKALVAFEWSLFIPVDAPNEHACNFHSLHFSGDLRGFEVDFVDETWELDSLVARHDPSAETNSALHHISISDDNHPLISFGLHPKLLGNLVDLETSRSQDNER